MSVFLMPWYGWAILAGTQLVGHLTPINSYVGINVGYSNPNKIEFQNPGGVMGIQYDIKKKVRVFAEHISSIPDDSDWGFSHVGVKYLIPMNEKTTAYVGASIHHEDFDTKEKDGTVIKNPFIITGVEYGTPRLKVYGEFLGASQNIEQSRVMMGLKYLSD